MWLEISERLKLVRVYTVQAHGSRAAQMHCMYTAPKQNVQKVILLRILVVSKRLRICLKLETRNIKKKYRLLPGRKHFCLQMICKRPSNYTSWWYFWCKSNWATRGKMFGNSKLCQFCSYSNNSSLYINVNKSRILENKSLVFGRIILELLNLCGFTNTRELWWEWKKQGHEKIFFKN